MRRAEVTRSAWWGAARALLILVIVAVILDSLALTGGPLVLIPPMLPLYFLVRAIGHYAGGC